MRYFPSPTSMILTEIHIHRHNKIAELLLERSAICVKRYLSKKTDRAANIFRPAFAVRNFI